LTKENEVPENGTELKRDIGIWGSFSMGFADVGADIFIALGVIASFAGVTSPVALLIAAITYVCTGLCYAELATAYPVAGGGHYYTMKAFGKVHGFIAGWGLMLDYTIDIALFALATVGYLGFILKNFFSNGTLLISPYYAVASVILIIFLIGLNIIGIRHSSRLNEAVVGISLLTVSIFFLFGLPYIILSGSLFTWFGEVASSFAKASFGFNGQGYFAFAYAVSIASASYIGIESISQAAEETRRPSLTVPRATKAAIISVIFVAVVLSLLSVTLLPWQVVAENSQAPAVPIAERLPVIGNYFGIWVAVVGALICYVSTNTGVIGVSRVTYSMGRLALMPRGLSRVSLRFKTPYVTITIFSLVACLILVSNLALPGDLLLQLVTSLYNFGALIAYMYVNLAAIVLRIKEPVRKGWIMPLNFNLVYKGKLYKVSVIPFIGFISSAVVWFFIVGLHETGRLIGTIWFIFGICLYLAYQYYRRRSIERKH
jgi:APA family basic amino acid/polyamine antiporter